MFQHELSKDYFALFELSKVFVVDEVTLAERYRLLQRQSHPDMHAAGDLTEKRIALQYSGLINQAYSTLKSSSKRALYLLELEGLSNQQVQAHAVNEEFLFEQMEIRQKLEDLEALDEPDTMLEETAFHLAELQLKVEKEFVEFYEARDFAQASSSANCLLYLSKIREELSYRELNSLEKR